MMNLLFSFNGRINRGKLWLAVLIFVIYGIVASIIGSLLLGSAIANSMSGGEFDPSALLGAGLLGIAVLVVLYVVALVAGFAVGIKRLHDRNKSGWWILLFALLPMVLSFTGMAMADSPVGMLLTLAGLVINIWAFVELGCLRGTVGPNNYGPDPLEGSAVPASV